MSTDIPDLIAGALGVSRGTAYDMMRDVLAEQPAQQEPVAWMHEWEDGERIPMLTGRDDRNNDQPKSVRPLVYGDTTPPASKPDFKAFKEWAVAAGYDTAHAHDGMKWVCLNPMTADLWKAWQAAHGIKGDA